MSNELDGIRVSKPNEPIEFPIEEIQKGNGVIGLTIDNDVMFVLPQVVIDGTFFLLFGNHLPMSCSFIDALAYHINEINPKDSESAEFSGAINGLLVKVKQDLLKRHGLTEFKETFVHKGDKTTFDGAYYGVMSTMDLAAIGYVMKELSDAVPQYVKDATPEVARIANMWITAAENFVTPAERMSVIMGGTEGRA